MPTQSSPPLTTPKGTPMTSEKELRKIAVQVIREYQAYDVGDSFEVPGLTNSENDRVKALIRTWPIPDLPPSYHANRPAWNRHGMRITPGEDSGDVLLEWGENDNDMPVTLNLASSQVQAIIAAHYHREDQE